MRALALLLLIPSAQAWEFCANEGQTCTVPSPSVVRFGEPWGNRWTERAVTGSVPCALATFGDPSPGTGKRCEYKPAAGEATLQVTWTHATQNTDGSALTNRTGYRVEHATAESGPWSPLATVTGAEATAKVPYGQSCVRVVTLASGSESAPSTVVCVTKAPPTTTPRAPGNVKATKS